MTALVWFLNVDTYIYMYKGYVWRYLLSYSPIKVSCRFQASTNHQPNRLTTDKLLNQRQTMQMDRNGKEGAAQQKRDTMLVVTK